MADAAGSSLVTRRNLRLASGLTLFSYAGLHLVNHALGLHSLAAGRGDAARSRCARGRACPGRLLLYGAAAIHVGLAFLALYERRTLRMPPDRGAALRARLLDPAAADRPRVRHASRHRDGRQPDLRARSSGDLRRRPRLAAVRARGAGVDARLDRHHAVAASPRHGSRACRTCSWPSPCCCPCSRSRASSRWGASSRRWPTSRRSSRRRPPTRTELDAAQRRKLEADRDGWLGAFWLLLGGVVVARGVRRVVQSRRQGPFVTLRYPDARCACRAASRCSRRAVPTAFRTCRSAAAARAARPAACASRRRRACRRRGRRRRATLARIRAPRDVRLACQLRPVSDLDVAPVFASDGSHAPARGRERRARGGRAVHRPAPLDRPRGARTAVRPRVRAEPVLRRGRRRRRGGRRPAQPVRRRQRDGDLRPGVRSRQRLPPVARRRAGHRGAHARGQPAHAAAVRALARLRYRTQRRARR